jgi:hypothetical protein
MAADTSLILDVLRGSRSISAGLNNTSSPIDFMFFFFFYWGYVLAGMNLKFCDKIPSLSVKIELHISYKLVFNGFLFLYFKFFLFCFFNLIFF